MRALRAYVLVLIAAAVVAGCGGGTTPGGGGGGGGGGGKPPVGVVWFGTAFDPASLAVSGQTTTVKTGSPIVAVGNFLSPKPPQDLTVQIQALGSTVARLKLPEGQPATTFGIDLSSQNLAPGSYLVNFVDNRRRTLASGNLTVTP